MLNGMATEPEPRTPLLRDLDNGDCRAVHFSLGAGHGGEAAAHPILPKEDAQPHQQVLARPQCGGFVFHSDDSRRWPRFCFLPDSIWVPERWWLEIFA